MANDNNARSFAALAPERILNADCSLFRLLVVTESFEALLAAQGLTQYPTVLSPPGRPAMGDLVIIEGYDKTRLQDVFPDHPDAVEAWNSVASLFKVEHLTAKGWRRILRALPLSPEQLAIEQTSGGATSPNGITLLPGGRADLSMLVGLSDLPIAINRYLSERVGRLLSEFQPTNRSRTLEQVFAAAARAARANAGGANASANTATNPSIGSGPEMQGPRTSSRTRSLIETTAIYPAVVEGAPKFVYNSPFGIPLACITPIAKQH
ncbi:hypothetical protein JCM10908_001362 [Rhodotorula pacifica]|uniref:uncharacterized protein n=1 Tax=Rhodotorula pacifica TaxID=1495444 RepID=UPI00317D4F75